MRALWIAWLIGWMGGCQASGILEMGVESPCDDDVADDDAADDDATDDDTAAVEFDCDDLPQGPFEYAILFGPKATEDLAFDDQGNVIGADVGNLFKSTYAGDASIWVPGAGGFIAGLRALPSGDIVYSDVTTGTLFRVDGDGAHVAVLSGLQYANGIEVDLDGHVYVAEQTGGRVRRIDPYSGEFDMVAEGLPDPNGVSFSPDYRTLYVSSFGSGAIYAVPFDEHGQPGEPEAIVQQLGYGMLDGMAVDACGNIYVCEYWAAQVWRISPDGSQQQRIVDFSGDTEWIPNMQWGSGLGGWATDRLYVLDIAATKLYEVPVGVPDKPRAYP